jgi:uncharacterized protein YecT (DUF1311 family)
MKITLTSFLVFISITTNLNAQKLWENGMDSLKAVDIINKVKTEKKEYLAILKKEDVYNANEIEFMLDTFELEKMYAYTMDDYYCNTCMQQTAYFIAAEYDKLLNKYYKKLLAKFSAKDKTALIEAQRAWVKFNKLDLHLTDTAMKDEYTGGGTMWRTIRADSYLQKIKTRVLEIGNLYNIMNM